MKTIGLIKTGRAARAMAFAAGALVTGIATGASNAQEAYELRPGDVLEFWVAQDEQLNRDVTIGPDGRLSLPMVGHLAAEGMTLDELEQEAADRLRRFYTEDLDLTIMLQPHPSHMPSVFVAGEVTQPGVFPYRPGMMVLHAITLAGGPYRTALAVSDVDRAILLRSEIEAGRKSVVELNFAVARLEAELAGADEIAVPADLEPGLDAAQVAEIQRREQALLQLRRLERTSFATTSDQLRRTSERNLEAVRQQQATVVRRKELLETRLASATTLVDRGHMQRSQLLEQQGDLALLDATAAEMDAQLAAAEASLITEQGRAADGTRERQVEIVTELNDTRRQLEALVARLADNRRALAVYEAEGASNAEEVPVTYRIIRTTDQGATEIEAERSTIIQPGDLVEVVKGAAGSRVAGSMD